MNESIPMIQIKENDEPKLVRQNSGWCGLIHLKNKHKTTFYWLDCVRIINIRFTNQKSYRYFSVAFLMFPRRYNELVEFANCIFTQWRKKQSGGVIGKPKQIIKHRQNISAR